MSNTFTTVGYLFKELWRKHWKAPRRVALITALLIIAVCGVWAAFLVLSANAGYASDVTLIGNQQDVDIIVYLESLTARTRINDLHREILSWNEVARVQYKTKEEIEAALKGVSSSDLRARFWITLNNSEQVEVEAEAVSARLRALRNTEGTIQAVELNRQDAVDEVLAFPFRVQLGSLFILLSLTIAAIATLYSLNRTLTRIWGEELELMRRVGVHKRVARMPFLLLGGVYGLLGSAVIAVALYLTHLSLRNPEWAIRLPALLNGEIVRNVALSLPGFGILIGLIGSAFGVRGRVS
ncbi:MAG: cell division protein FtsX [Candidatus Bipolaricaulia bacterium]